MVNAFSVNINFVEEFLGEGWRGSASVLGADRYGSREVPRGEGRPGDGRQGPAFADAVRRDVIGTRVCHINEPPEEVQRHGHGLGHGLGPHSGLRRETGSGGAGE
jgi:hypothetical protein